MWLWLCLQSAVLMITSEIIFAETIVKTCSPPYYFACENKQCISSSFVCDGEDDCGDLSDEKNCIDTTMHKPCTAVEFKCADKLCIPRERVCDGIIHCLDKSDELEDCRKNVTCNGFRCKNQICIPSMWRCDGSNDCGDNSDEENCTNKKGKKNFQLILERKNWHGALVHCISQGMGLATIESKEEQDTLVNQIKSSDVGVYKTEWPHRKRWWLGGSDLHLRGDFMWTSTARPIVYHNFKSGQPDSAIYGTGERERCLELAGEDTVGLSYHWNDYMCEHNQFFVCQYYD